MKLTMRLGVRSYDIIIKQGGLSRVGQLINLNRRVLVVSDTGVPEAYLKTVLAQCREGVPVVVGSDAHFVSAVGGHQYAQALLDELDFPEELVLNREPAAFLAHLERRLSRA